MVSESREEVDRSSFLTTTHGVRRNKETCIFSSESALSPEWTRSIPECLMITKMSYFGSSHDPHKIIAYLPLDGHVSETSRNTKEECVVLCQGIDGGNGITWLRWGAHDLQELIRERLCNSVIGIVDQ